MHKTLYCINRQIDIEPSFIYYIDLFRWLNKLSIKKCKRLVNNRNNYGMDHLLFILKPIIYTYKTCV